MKRLILLVIFFLIYCQSFSLCIPRENIESMIIEYNEINDYEIKRFIYEEISNSKMNIEQDFIKGNISEFDFEVCKNRYQYFFESIDNDDNKYNAF